MKALQGIRTSSRTPKEDLKLVVRAIVRTLALVINKAVALDHRIIVL